VLVDYSIGVKYEAGTAMLMGRVANEQQMQTAIEMARHMADVSHVINKLEVKPTQSPITPVAAKSTEANKQLMKLPFLSANAAPVTKAASSGKSNEAPAAPKDPLISLSFPKFSNSNADRSEAAAARRMSSLARESTEKSENKLQLTGYESTSGSVNRGSKLESAPEQAPLKVASKPVSAKPVAASKLSTVGARSATPVTPVSNSRVASLPAGAGGASAASYGGGVYDQPQMPSHAWPSYASYPNYAAVQYPKQYSPTAWPYIGPFYPYPQVPLGWRRVTLEWDDGWWFLEFDAKREASRRRWHPNR